MRTHMSILNRMPIETVSGRFETLWQADGLFDRPERLKRLYGLKTGSMEWGVIRQQSKEKSPRMEGALKMDGYGGYSADFAIFLNFEKNRMLNYNEEDKKTLPKE